jgi:modulator of FtsH protease HflC
MRLQTLDIKSSRIVTAEQKDVIVDYYVKWRISDPVLYYTRASGSAQHANLLLEQQLNDGLRAQFGRRTISEVVSDDRTTIMDALSQQANVNAQKLGIQVIDVRIKRIDLPTEVSTAVFERMRAERERVAMEHRSTGKASAEAIRANADANVTVMIAMAKEQAANLRAQADAQAAKVYTDAYSQNPDFYAFYRSLLAYKKVFNNRENNILVLRPDSQFFKYFNADASK